MKKLIFATLLSCFIFSCSKKESTYYFVDILDEKDIHGKVSRIEKIDTLEFENDSIACVRAYQFYCNSLKNDKDFEEVGHESYNKQIDYKVYNSENKILNPSKYLTEKIKNEIKNDIFNKPNPLKNNASESVNVQTEDIESQFSKWDGSHTKLVEYVKNEMNDPDSFEHVNTKAGRKDNYIKVEMTFRGKNSFNATITKTIVARCDILTGEVLEIMQ